MKLNARINQIVIASKTSWLFEEGDGEDEDDDEDDDGEDEDDDEDDDGEDLFDDEDLFDEKCKN